MNRVTKRTWLMSVFIVILMAGLILFLGEYALKARKWVVFTGSPHVYNNANIGLGTLTDRSGEVLLDITDKRTYSENENTRKSTLHWLGDRKGFISAAAVTNYAAEMSGFDLVNGLYSADGTGGSMTLTLSAKAQNAALKAMKDRKGTVGVYNYKTGEILCAVTTPTYDPENVPDISADKTGAYDGVYVNRFIQSAYIPGSIFKVVTTAAALDCVEGIEEMTFHCTARREYGKEAVTCQKAHGTQNLKQALANSCNCAFSYIAEEVGKQNMIRYVEKFGITSSLSFDGITTAKGNYNVSEAAPVSFAWSCIGQYNDLINPAQYMTFMGAIANGGAAAEPYLVARVEGGGEVTYEAEPRMTEKLLSSEIAGILTEYMRNNVVTIYGADRFPNVKVCGKSGTSELGGEQAANAMFAGFIADEQYPLAFVAIVENGGSGARTCVPVLNTVLKACMEVLDSE